MILPSGKKLRICLLAAAKLILHVFCNEEPFESETNLHLTIGQEVLGVIRLKCINMELPVIEKHGFCF